MNQKIEASPPASLRPLPLSADRRVAAASAPNAQPITPVRASDCLRLTCEAAGLQVLQRGLSAAPAIDQARVDAVRAELDSGQYRVNPEVIAERMLTLNAQLGA